MYRLGNPNPTKRITLPWDTSETKAVFIVSNGLSVKIRAMLTDRFVTRSLTKDRAEIVFRDDTYSRNVEILKHGLKGVENLEDENGNEIKLSFNTDGTLDDKSIELFNVQYDESGNMLIDYLANQIWFVNKTSEQEIKN